MSEALRSQLHGMLVGVMAALELYVDGTEALVTGWRHCRER